MKISFRFVAIASFCFVLGQVAFSQQPCEALKNLQVPHVEITSVTVIPAGPFGTGIPALGIKPPILPETCDVKAIARPTSDSAIGIEVWLPGKNWNGKYMQIGNGGWAGSINPGFGAGPLSAGYVAAATDDGHKAGKDTSAEWAIGHPEKLIDFGYRSLHETRSLAGALIKAFYGRDPKQAYFAGCSDGGREALMVAQRYPEDFNGIVSGAPANYWSHQFTDFAWNRHALVGPSGTPIPPAKLAAIQKAAVAACDTLDGVKDGLIQNPAACHFDPTVLTCKGADGPDCLTAPQVTTLSKIYAGPKNPRTGEQIFPGFPVGTENIPFGWAFWITSANPNKNAQFEFVDSYFGQAVFERNDWDFQTLDFDKDVALADRKAGAVIDATNPDLRSFRAHGGKLIQYHGWGDAAITAYGSILYYDSVKSFLATYPDPRSEDPKNIDNFYRLFLVPGMAHCGLGIGTTMFGQVGFGGDPGADPERNIMYALDRWVEKGIAPDRIIATGKAPEDPSKNMSRPLCAYPKVARYKGTGDIYDAANFECAVETVKH